MAANVTQGRYPKRSRAAVNYNVEKLSTDNDIDLGDGDAGEDSIAADGTSGTTVVAAAKQSGADANGDSDSSLSSIESANSLEELEALEALSELEDATYGSRKTKKVCHTLSYSPESELTVSSRDSLRRRRPNLDPWSSALTRSYHSDSCEFPPCSRKT